MKDRIRQIMTDKGLSASKLAEHLQVQPSGISHILSGRNKPGMDFIEKCLNAFPDINPEWFVLGRGPVYRNASLAERGRTWAASDVSEGSRGISDALQEDSITFTPQKAEMKNASLKGNDLFSHSPTDSLISENIGAAGATSGKDASRSKPNKVTDDDGKHICRVMIFYSDHTVESFDYSENE